MSTIDVTLFGCFKIVGEGRELNIGNISSEKITKLLCYFILNCDRMIPAQELMDLLWNDEVTENPAAALKNLVYRMRTLLKKNFGKKEYILTGRGTYFWNPEISLCVDARKFEEVYKIAKTTTDRALMIPSLEKTIELYKGKLMSQLSGDYWIISLQTHYHSEYLTAIQRLAELYEEEYNYEGMISVCKLGIAQDSLDETLQYYLVKGYIGMKNYSMALKQYKIAVKEIQEALGVGTPVLLKELYQTLMAMDDQDEANLEDVQEELGEECPQGAFSCDYGVFCEIYRLEARRIYRLGISEYIALFTVEEGKNRLSQKKPQFMLMKKATKRLEEMIIESLRVGDVVSRYSEFQVAVLLPTCTYEDVVMISNRILDKFYKEFRHERIQITYNMDEVSMAEPFTVEKRIK